MPEETQLADGRWVPAQPLPYYLDSRPWYVRLWHCVLVIWYFRDEDKADELMEPWWVPEEPACRKD
jgi:hypothetical protein